MMGRFAWNLRAAFYDQVFRLPLFRRIREEEDASFKELTKGFAVQDARILDVACGTGHYMKILGGGRLYGLDYSAEMLRIAGDKQKASLVLGDARHLPFKTASMDRVVCIGLLEYFGDREAVLREISRVLMKDGLGVLSYSRKNIFNTLRNLLGSRVHACSVEEFAISLNKCLLEWVNGRESLLQGQVLCRKA